jgi:ribosomal protein S17
VLQVHDELNEADIGDVIIIKHCFKHSKMKAFELFDIAIKYPAADFLNKVS